MNKKVRWEFKLLTASYAKAFVEKKFTPGMDSGDWSMRDSETGLIYVCPRPNKSFDIRPDWTVIKAEHICVCDAEGNLVEDNGFDPASVNFAENAVKYYGVTQLLTNYGGDVDGVFARDI